ncbi:MAG: ABC transporter transmembrane domain-containing protein [Actinopolymorphaceae bacterium]
MTPTTTVRRTVLRCLWPGRRQACALGVAILLTTVLPLLAPQLTRRFVDDAIAGHPASQLTLIALGYLGLAVSGQVARMLTAWLASRLAWDGTNRLRETLAEHALGLDMAYHGQRTPGEMIERVDGDVVAVAEFVVAFLLDIVVSLLILVGVIVMVFAVDLRIGVVLLAYCTLMGFLMIRAQRWAIPSATRVRGGSPRCSATSRSGSPARRTSGPTALGSTSSTASTRRAPMSTAPTCGPNGSAAASSPVRRWDSPPAPPSCSAWPPGPKAPAR